MLIGALIAFGAFLIGYGVGFTAASHASAPTRTLAMTGNARLTFDECGVQFPMDTSRGLLQ